MTDPDCQSLTNCSTAPQREGAAHPARQHDLRSAIARHRPSATSRISNGDADAESEPFQPGGGIARYGFFAAEEMGRTADLENQLIGRIAARGGRIAFGPFKSRASLPGSASAQCHRILEAA